MGASRGKTYCSLKGVEGEPEAKSPQAPFQQQQGENWELEPQLGDFFNFPFFPSLSLPPPFHPAGQLINPSPLSGKVAYWVSQDTS